MRKIVERELPQKQSFRERTKAFRLVRESPESGRQEGQTAEGSLAKGRWSTGPR